jgi:hypothetical protein
VTGKFPQKTEATRKNPSGRSQKPPVNQVVRLIDKIDRRHRNRQFFAAENREKFS